ncbi:MAG TPA: DNA-processing protein DprA, partial [Gemmatales bacterium]|nr:DNA-processing protein DprA [Gemmatales bacterium]
FLQASPADWETVPHIGPKTVELLKQALAHQDMAAELALVEKHNARLLHIDHPDYPSLLRTIPTAPGFLFACGSFTEADSRSIAIVGSRHCTAYGRRVAKNLAEGLARAGWTIVSGLARGIDSIAHTAALEAGGRTVAVLAGGIGKLYPPEHKELAERIVLRGVLLSEMPMGMAPMPDLFP